MDLTATPQRAQRRRPSRPDGEGPLAEHELTAPARFVDGFMEQFLEKRALPEKLREAVAYALLAPGKRMRPVLVIRSCEAVGGRAEDAVVPAAAIEMIHAFSLVHDDLPAMDDDDLRRGRPTLHRHTSEAMAILAGDALQGLALELVTSELEPPPLAAAVAAELSRACNDMIAGQVYDTVPGAIPGLAALDRLVLIHRHKTGALIRAACRMGARCGDASDGQLAALTAYGEAVGHMFQVVDDLLDVTQTTEHLGKTAGKDAEQEKLTYPALLGIEGSRREVRRLHHDALDALVPLGEPAETLRRLCDYLAVRTR